MDFLDVDKQERKRREYFRRHGYPEPPYEQDARYALARELISGKKPDAEAAYMLYNHLQDCKHVGFVRLIGSIFATPGTPLYNVKQAEAFARKAYLYAGELQQDDTAQEYLSTHLSARHDWAAVLLKPGNNLVVTDALSVLMNKDVEPQALRYDHNATLTDFAKAIFQGTGQGMPRDDTKATAAYETYIQNQPKGFLVLAYQNLGLRYALGLGCSPDLDKADRLLETAEFLIDQGQGKFKNLRDLLKDYAKNQADWEYRNACGYLQHLYSTRQSPWPFIDLIREAHERIGNARGGGALLDTVGLFTMLAQAENWPDVHDWLRIQGFARKKFNRDGLYADIHTVKNMNYIELFYTGVEQEPSRLALAPHRLMLFKYFREKNLGIPPVTQAERMELAQKASNDIPINFELPLILFNPEEDLKSADWMLLVGFIYDQHIDNPYFDPKKAVIFFERASSLGSGSASYNMGLKYSQGSENEIDLPSAFYWLNKAKDQGNVEAQVEMLDLKVAFDERYQEPDQREFRHKIVQEAWGLFLEGNLYAVDRVTRFLCNGKGCERDEKTATEILEKLLSMTPQFHTEQAYYGMLYRYALRLYLGLGVTENLDKTLQVLNHIPEKSVHSYIQFTLNDDIKTLRNIIIEEKKSPKNFQFAKEKIRRVCQDQSDPESNVLLGLNDATLDVVWAVAYLAGEESWCNRDKWTTLLNAVQARRLGLNFEDILKSTGFQGPRYNSVAANGMPVMGAWEKASKNEQEVERQISETGSYVPEAGIIQFNGLKLNKDKTIDFDFIMESNRPALLVPEDFEVALALAFGNPEGTLRPYLSLEDPSRHGFKTRHRSLLFKEWNPFWLGYTDLGRTLYMTDQLIGAICWCPQEFDIATQEQARDSKIFIDAKNLVNDIRLTGGRGGKGGSTRVMLVPEHISISVDRDNGPSVYVREVKMRIDGDYIIRGEGREKDIHLALNDDVYKQGRTVNKLTRRFNDISAQMPVFARGRELMALMNAAKVLREVMDEAGLKLQPKLQAHITQYYRMMEAKTQLPRHEQLCVNLPTLRKTL